MHCVWLWVGAVDAGEEASAHLLAQLLEVGPAELGLLGVGGRGEEAAEREARVAGDAERLVRHRGERLEALGRRGALLEPLQALRDVEGEVDEDAVGAALDLKVLEEHVGLEEPEHLVDDVVLT